MTKASAGLLGATVLKAVADRNAINTADVDDVIWGTSSQVGKQSRDLGRMAALDAFKKENFVAGWTHITGISLKEYLEK